MLLLSEVLGINSFAPKVMIFDYFRCRWGTLGADKKLSAYSEIAFG